MKLPNQVIVKIASNKTEQSKTEIYTGREEEKYSLIKLAITLSI